MPSSSAAQVHSSRVSDRGVNPAEGHLSRSRVRSDIAAHAGATKICSPLSRWLLRCACPTSDPLLASATRVGIALALSATQSASRRIKTRSRMCSAAPSSPSRSASSSIFRSRLTTASIWRGWKSGAATCQCALPTGNTKSITLAWASQISEFTPRSELVSEKIKAEAAAVEDGCESTCQGLLVLITARTIRRAAETPLTSR